MFLKLIERTWRLCQVRFFNFLKKVYFLKNFINGVKTVLDLFIESKEDIQTKEGSN